jgi:hypothetical protein
VFIVLSKCSHLLILPAGYNLEVLISSEYVCFVWQCWGRALNILGQGLTAGPHPSPNVSLHNFQAKETNSKQKEFEETAKHVRYNIEQLAALE